MATITFNTMQVDGDGSVPVSYSTGSITTTEILDDTVASADIAAGAIVNSDVNASAAVAWSKMANLTDAQILVGNGSNVATDVAVSGDVSMANTGAVTISNDAVTEAKVADSDGTGGLYVKKYAAAVYDFSVDGGSQGAITLADTATIPDNAIVVATHYDVVTTCTSSSDAATIKLDLPTDGDLSTAIAISDASNPWDQGVFSALEGNGAFGTAPSTVKTTAARAVQITVAGGEDLTAGKIVFYVEYLVSA